MSNTASTTVETLTATVNVMQVAKQLDHAPAVEINVIGRIRYTGDERSKYSVRVIGQHKTTGELVTATMRPPSLAPVDLSDFPEDELPLRPDTARGKNGVYGLSDGGLVFYLKWAETSGRPPRIRDSKGEPSRPVAEHWDLGRRSDEILQRAKQRNAEWEEATALFHELQGKPLIVLAGLR